VVVIPMILIARRRCRARTTTEGLVSVEGIGRDGDLDADRADAPAAW